MRSRPALLLLLALLGAGCGGGSHPAPERTALARLDVDWPEVARGVPAPGSAHLASIELASTGADPARVTFGGPRPSGTAATVQTYAAATALPTGVYLLTVHFLTNVDGTGAETATATAAVLLRADGALVRPDGSPLGAVATVGRVAAVAVAADQRVAPGTTAYVVFSVQDTAGRPLAVALDAATLSVVQGADKAVAGPYARLRGLAVGTAAVTVAVDGVTSPVARVAVDGLPIATRDVALATGGLVADPVRNRLWVALPAGAVADLDPASGALGAPIPVGDKPSPLALTDSAATLYVGLLGEGTVRPVDLATRTPGPAFALPASLASPHPYRVAAAPGSDTVVAVSAGQSGIAVFDSGVARPNALRGDPLDTFVWTSTNRLLAYSSQTESIVREATVDAGGLTAGRRVTGAFDTFSLDLRLAGGTLYGAHGAALDAADLKPVTGFASPPLLAFYDESAGPVIDAAANRAYFLVMNGSELYLAPRLRVFRLDDRTLLADRPFANVETSVGWFPYTDPGFTAWGAHGLAFRTPNHVYLIDDATRL